MAEKRKNGAKTGRSLNLVLWFCFSLFAIVVVLVFTVVQNALVDRHYRKKTVEKLETAGAELLASIEPNAGEDQAVSLIMQAYKTYGVSGYMISSDGQSLFPDLTDQKSYPALAESLNKLLSGEQENVIVSYGNTLIYAAETSFGGQSCYLCVTKSLDSLTDLEEGMGLISFVMVLIAIVLSFAASGFVAVLITKPVNEVTERAKQLARGEYSLDFKENYFCREINELSEALDYARIEISKADKMQRELIANVSHDFKTPLTMIKAYASMIREISGDDKEKRDAHAKIIIDESDRLTALVVDLLDISKLRAGFGADERAVFNLSEEVYRVAERFDYLKETAGYEIETEVESDLYISANRARTEQVLYNLIGNAVNYTGEDKKVKVRLFLKGENPRFEVIDSGAGIKKEEIPTIWDRYYRSSEMHKRPVKGTGLGLSIVKSVLEAHGYSFGVESEEGKGSTFWVEFFPAPKEESAETERTEEPAKKKKREKKKDSEDEE